METYPNHSMGEAFIIWAFTPMTGSLVATKGAVVFAFMMVNTNRTGRLFSDSVHDEG